MEYWLVRQRGKLAFEELPLAARARPVADGHGYYGVALYDPLEDKVQCHICGGWFTFLLKHVLRGHGASPEEYRSDFGLGGISLCGLKFSQTMRDVAVDNELCLRGGRLASYTKGAAVGRGTSARAQLVNRYQRQTEYTKMKRREKWASKESKRHGKNG